jgi:RHS repeat-associated protein
VRGNLTGRTDYFDVVTPGSVTYNRKIDIFGNVVQQQVSCCNLDTYVYSGNTDWSSPDQVIKGDPNGVHITKLITTDFNTSQPSGETDPNSLNTTFGYDNSGRLNQASYPSGAIASAVYNDSAQTVSRSLSYDDGGTQKLVTTSIVYDGLGRVIQQVDANGGQVNTSYDAMGRVASRTNPFPAGGTPGPSTSYVYDALGRSTTVTLPDSQITQYSYNGNTVTVTDQVNRKTQKIIDGLGRVATVNEQDVSTGSLTQATDYSYDYLNNITQVNRGSQLRSFKYDAIGRLTYENVPEQSATINDGTGTLWSSKYTYTTFNSVATRQDARGVITSYSYDAVRRLSQVTYNTVGGVSTAPTVTYTFDSDPTYGTTANGLLVRVNVGSDYQERYTFDSSFRIASAIRTIGSRTYTTGYGYDQGSQIIQLTYPSARVLTLNHDSNGRLSGLSETSNGNTYLSNVAYNAAGQVTGDTLGAVTEQFGYDVNRMELTSQKAGTVSPYTNRMNLTYGYQASAGQMGSGSTAGNAGQLMSVSGTINGTTESAAYTYDNLSRVVTSNQTSNGASAQRRFGYDAFGNRSGVWDATSGGNQIQSITLQQSGGVPTDRIQSVTTTGTVSYSYDAAGNVTNDGAHTYTYDSENSLVSVDGGATGSYAYDHQHRRYKTTVGSTVTHFVWEREHVLAEHNGSTGASLIDYIYSGSRMVAKLASGGLSYFVDERISPSVILDASGNVSGRQSHLPFGEDFGESGSQDKHHFTSYERDSGTGLDYAVNRYYSAAVGRFTGADPALDRELNSRKTTGCQPKEKAVQAFVDDPEELNLYSYARNDSVNSVDPLGLWCFPFDVFVDGIEVPDDFFCDFPLGPLPFPTPQASPACQTCCRIAAIACLLAAVACVVAASGVLVNSLGGCRTGACKTGTHTECKKCKRTARIVFELAIVGCGLGYFGCRLLSNVTCAGRSPNNTCHCWP